MALYHFHVTQIKRSAGQSAIASAAYRAGEKLYSEYYGETSDYSKKKGVICSEILLPPNASPAYADRQTLWNALELVERNKDAQLAYSGFNTIIFLAEMGAINKEVYEAAIMDGATPWQLDRYITLPLMKNIFGTCVVLASVAMVSQFDIIYMTTKGGPGTSTLNLPTYLYKIMTLENNYGKANAVGVVQIALGLVLVVLIRRLFRDRKEMGEV